MLLASADTHQQFAAEETFIIQLLAQSRYAEAYILLKQESPNQPATQYNLALCYYQNQYYREAIACLDKTLAILPLSDRANINTDQFYNAIRQQQNQHDDHLLGVTKKYISFFGDTFRDTITRLKTDCWLQLGDYAKVIETATPIAHKSYKNIAKALSIAKN